MRAQAASAAVALRGVDFAFDEALGRDGGDGCFGVEYEAARGRDVDESLYFGAGSAERFCPGT